MVAPPCELACVGFFYCSTRLTTGHRNHPRTDDPASAVATAARKGSRWACALGIPGDCGMFVFLHKSVTRRPRTLRSGDHHPIAPPCHGAFDLARRRTFLCANRVVCRDLVDVRIAPSGRFDGPLALLGDRGLAPSRLMRSFVRKPFSERSSAGVRRSCARRRERRSSS